MFSELASVETIRLASATVRPSSSGSNGASCNPLAVVVVVEVCALNRAARIRSDRTGTKPKIDK